MALRPIRGVSVAAGVGGIDLGLRLAMPDSYETVCYVEREAYCAEILARRMEEGHLSMAPVWSDLESFDGTRWRRKVDIVCAGLPCQPYSHAGSQKGHEDERAIWPEFIRIVGECNPALVFLENVPPFLNHFELIYKELREMGFILPPPGLYTAEECGAPHIRKRIFVLAANSRCINVWGESWWGGWTQRSNSTKPRNDGAKVTDATEQSKRESHDKERSDTRHHTWEDVGRRDGRTDQESIPDPHVWRRKRLRSSWILDNERPALWHNPDGCGDRCGTCRTPWATESPILRVDDGPSNRVDELRAIGNGVVPEMVAHAFTDLSNEARKMLR